jgi:DNA polymerase II small subunit/DNA polymerase delta subunit B
MATAKKKTVKKKTASNRKSPKKAPKKISASEKKEMLAHISETTQTQLKKISDKISASKEKDISILKDLAEKIRRFAGEATDLTKIKIEIHNLKNEHDNLLKVMGENLWNMHKAGTVKNVAKKFRYDFQKLEEIEKKIAEKEEEAAGITLDLKSIE